MAIGLIKAAQGSPASHAPLITPAPVLHKRFFDSDFVGYVLFSDGDSMCIFSRLYDVKLIHVPSQRIDVQIRLHVYLCKRLCRLR
jgi:hypothetical protein